MHAFGSTYGFDIGSIYLLFNGQSELALVLWSRLLHDWQASLIEAFMRIGVNEVLEKGNLNLLFGLGVFIFRFKDVDLMLNLC